jgi:hypothetical protein
MSAATPQVLLAARAIACGPFRLALAGHAELVEIETLAESVSYLTHQQPPALICCTILFDESRMFDLLRWVKTQRPDVPFVCARALQKDMPKITTEAVRIASVSLGAAFIDVPELARQHGDAATPEKLRAALLAVCENPRAP